MRKFMMRKYIWMACLAVALVAIAGLAHAHGTCCPRIPREAMSPLPATNLRPVRSSGS